MNAHMMAARHPGLLTNAPGLVRIGGGLLADPDLLRAAWRQLPAWFRARARALDGIGGGILAMAGFLPDEGEAMIADQVFKNVTTDRGTNLDLNLFTNVTPGETITAATLTRPTGTGYAAITLADASWTGAADTRSYAQQTFTGGAGGWTGSVQGYDITSKGTTARIVAIEVDGNGPYTINENDTYKITPNVTFA